MPALSLPAGDADTANSEADRFDLDALQIYPGRSLCVLIAEDSKFNQQVLAGMLERIIAEKDRIEHLMSTLAPVDPEARVTTQGGINRPPMPDDLKV